MLKNYLLLAARNLLKNRAFSAINILGLGLGLAVSMLILLYVSHELSFDRFHPYSGRIFSTLMKLKMGETDLRMNLFAPDFGEKVRAANPEVVEVVRLGSDFRQTAVIKSENERQFSEERFFFADPSIFKVFQFDMVAGDPATALSDPDAVVINRAVAEKYFGLSDPLGQTLLYNQKTRLRVTGIFDPMPTNSSLQFDFIAATAAFERLFRAENPKGNFDTAPNFQTWFLLDNAASQAKVEAAIPSILPKTGDMIFDNATYALSPLAEMHLGNNWGDFSNQKYIGVFMVVAALVLFLALFNYMNLTTALAATRAREVGVRKVMGATRGQLGGQFYGESLLVTALGFGAGLAFFALLRPLFFDLLDLKIDANFLRSPLFIGVLTGLFAITALIAGSYPSLLLSRFSPINVLKGGTVTGHSGERVRRGLMVFQFAVSTALIIVSLGIRQQIEYMQNRPLGLNRDQVLAVPLTSGAMAHLPAFRQDIKALSGVEKTAMTSFALFKGGWDMTFLKTPTTQEDVGINNMVVDEHFFDMLEIDWVTPPANPRDLAPKRQIVLNESGIGRLKITDNPIGQYLDMGRGRQEIAGIVRDFHFVGPQRAIEGMLFEVVPDTAKMPNRGAQLYVRLDAKASAREKIAAIGQIFKRYETDVPFAYYFMDEAFDKQFRAEQRMGYLFSGFTAVALLLACLGLLGLAAYTAERRTKEIGIRKVLGASIAGIAGLLAKDFLKLVLVAIVVASPVAYYYMEKWLADFAYRIDVQWWLFAAAGAAAVAIAFLTVGFQAVRAALANPVKSLRSE